MHDIENDFDGNNDLPMVSRFQKRVSIKICNAVFESSNYFSLNQQIISYVASYNRKSFVLYFQNYI